MNRSVVLFLWLLYLYPLAGCSLTLESRYYRTIDSGQGAADGSRSADGSMRIDVERLLDGADGSDTGVILPVDVSIQDAEEESAVSEDGISVDAVIFEEGLADGTLETGDVLADVARGDGMLDLDASDVGLVMDASRDVAPDLAVDIVDVRADAGMDAVTDARPDVAPDVPLDVVPDAPATYPATFLFRQDGISLAADYFVRWTLPGGTMTGWTSGHCAGGISFVSMSGLNYSSCTTNVAFPADTLLDFYPVYGSGEQICSRGECGTPSFSERAVVLWNGHRFAGTAPPYPVNLNSEVVGPGVVRPYLNVTLR